MKKLLVVALTIMSVCSNALPQNSQQSNARKVNTDPNSAKLITTDIPNFWRAFDLSNPENNLFNFKREYIDKGSTGLKDFGQARFTVCDLVNAVEKNSAHYKSVRQDTLKVDAMKEQVHASFRKLKEIYPEAVFPDVYFLIGANNSGGTVSENGLLIGVERFGGRIDELPYTVAHELIHFQQKYPEKQDLLGLAIMEGSADFVGELISGKSANPTLLNFGETRERELWDAFKKDWIGGDWGVWLYDANKAKARGLPKDMAYYIGYKITESYYKHAANKRQALKDIFGIKDFNQFLKDSKYEEKFISR